LQSFSNKQIVYKEQDTSEAIYLVVKGAFSLKKTIQVQRVAPNKMDLYNEFNCKYLPKILHQIELA